MRWPGAWGWTRPSRTVRLEELRSFILELKFRPSLALEGLTLSHPLIFHTELARSELRTSPSNRIFSDRILRCLLYLFLYIYIYIYTHTHTDTHTYNLYFKLSRPIKSGQIPKKKKKKRLSSSAINLSLCSIYFNFNIGKFVKLVYLFCYFVK